MSVLQARLFACVLVGMATIQLDPGYALDCSAAPARCPGASAPNAAAPPRWSVPLVGLPDAGTRIIVEGHGQGKDFVPTVARMVVEGPPSSSRPALPVDASLLAWMTALSFGEEQRAAGARGDDGLTLNCRAGAAPAGLVLSGGARLPEGARLSLRWRALSGDGFMIGVAAGTGEPRRFSPLMADEGLVSIDNALSSPDEMRITIVCPAAGGRLVLGDLRLLTDDAGSKAPSSAAWAWRPALWQEKPDELIADIAMLGVSRLFVSVDIDPDNGVASADRFAAFIRSAHATGLKIVVVEGDAGMALPQGRAHALARLAAIHAYQEAATADTRIDGLQYDIEPYLLPEFLTEPARVMHGWAETIAALRRATSLELEMVLPFWLASDEHAARHVLPALEASRSRIAIMAYRTGIHAIQCAAEPLLAWSSKAGLSARVALEAGPLPDETTQTFVSARNGALVLEQAPDGSVRAVLYDFPIAGQKGRRFAFSHELIAPASAVSFLGDRRRFLATAEKMQSILRAWPSFAGLAFHGMIE